MFAKTTGAQQEASIERTTNSSSMDTASGPTIDRAELLRKVGAREVMTLAAEKDYESPDPSAIPAGERAAIRLPDAQAAAVEKWLGEAKKTKAAGGDAGAIVVEDINGTRYGIHHAGEPAPQNTHYNIACFNENTNGGEKFRLQPGIDNPVDPNTTIWVRKLKEE